MKIRAVRLKEVGHFSSGIALEGLSGTFDVLAGPNEIGKSTIFKAIDAAFALKHDSEKARVLAPLSGGAPLIEIEFETGGVLWRLRKRYLAQKSAELFEIGNSKLLRGGDAEDRLRDLLGGSQERAGMRRLLWVGQRQSHVFPSEPDVALAVGNLIEAEIADAASSGVARRLRKDVTEALALLVTATTGRPKAQSPYKSAIEGRDAAKAECDRWRTVALAADARLRQLGELRNKQAELNSPSFVEQQSVTLANLRRQRDEVDAARKSFEMSILLVATKQAARDKAASHLQALTTAIADEAKLIAAVEAAAASLVSATSQVEAAKTSAAGLQEHRVACRRNLAHAKLQLDACDLHQRQDLATAAVEDCKARVAMATGLRRRAEEIERSLEAEKIDEAVVARLRRAVTDMAHCETKLVAMLPRVRIDYVEGAAGRISVGGEAVAASGEIAPAASLQLEIPGIGRITVNACVPAGEDPAANLARARRRYLDLCGEAGVVDIDSADARLSARLKLVNERDAALVRLNDVAPAGLKSLEQRLASALRDRAVLGAAIEPPSLDRAQIAADHTELVLQSDAIDDEERVAQSALLRASGRAEADRADAANAERQLADIVARLPPASARPTAISNAQAELASGDEALNLAVRERSAWSAAVLSPSEQAALQSDIAVAEKAQAQLAHDRQQIALDIKGLESGLERDRQDGIASALEEAREKHEELVERVASYKREVDELQLLDRMLEAAADQARTQELVPVISRLQEFADDLLPGAKFELGTALRVDGIMRAGQKLSAGQLSGGTSEQIHILVRLAYAKLAADRGTPMPLILDDALVYADDGRYDAMLAVLAKASASHQVIMLTCHSERTVKPAVRSGMNVVDLKTWDAG